MGKLLFWLDFAATLFVLVLLSTNMAEDPLAPNAAFAFALALLILRTAPGRA